MSPDESSQAYRGGDKVKLVDGKWVKQPVATGASGISLWRVCVRFLAPLAVAIILLQNLLDLVD